ncbi:MAG: hypothetical protein A07HR60_00507 [uncultured archaeon A07HR60]|nr:MAG: hypothetical protein A07HR60_00507 [uncultured archaeon A07HR60]
MSEPGTRLGGLTLCAIGVVMTGIPLVIGFGGPVTAISSLTSQTIGAPGGPGFAAGVGELVTQLYAVVGRPALVVFGVAFALTGGAKLRGNTLSARFSALVPVLAAGIVALSFGPAGLLSLTTRAIPPTVQSAVATVVVGSVVIPLVLASLQEDTLVLIVASTLLLAAGAVAPSSPVSLIVGTACGAGVVVTLWNLDTNTWQP